MSSSPLAERLGEAMAENGATLGSLSEATKVKESILRVLLGEAPGEELPPRVYLRGQVALISRHLRLEQEEALELFEESFPAPSREADHVSDGLGELPRGALAIAAGLGVFCLVAVVLAFAA